jgi:small-conductance mechanosensitive channel
MPLPAPLRHILAPAALAPTLLLPAPLAAAAQDTLPPPDTVAEAGADTLAPTAPPPEVVPAERAATDEEIRVRLQAIFDRIEALGGVEVEVEAGIVSLSGTVAQDGVVDRAVELARAQEGTLWVIDDVRLDTSLVRQMEPTWRRLEELGWALVARLPLLVIAGVVVALFGALGAKVASWGGPAWLHARNPLLRNIVGKALQAVVVLAGVLLALDLLEATALVGAIAGTAGLAGLALGFAFKDIVENYLAGILLALRQPFDANDHVIVGEHEGMVVRLTPRESILMTLDGNHVRVPNALIFRSAITNFTRNPRRRFSFEAGIGPTDDLARARDVGIEVLREMTGVLDDPPPQAQVTALGDSTVAVSFFGWVDQREADFFRVRSEAIRLIKLRLEDAGISLPSPEILVRMAEGAPGPTGVEAPARDTAAPGPGAETRMQADVSPDDSVERQIEEDRRVSDEEDLLQADAPD